MAADPKMWDALIEHLEEMRDFHQGLLTPLETGKFRIGSNGPETGGAWVDITDARIEQERNAISSLNRAITRLKAERDQRAKGT